MHSVKDASVNRDHAMVGGNGVGDAGVADI
jgi:hypothetical protein